MDNYIIDDIKARWDCRQVVGHDLGSPISKSGKWQSWPCPFHSEHTPGGFQVTRDGYKCFSCGENGDVIDWIVKYHDETFIRACEILNGGRLMDSGPKQTAERAAKHAEEVAQRLQREIENAQKALEELRQAQCWLRYHEQLTLDAMTTWYKWGVPEYWQEYWKLGYEPDRVIWTGKEEWHTPSMTIPVFAPGWECLNVRHRLLSPYRPGDKYRPERSGLPQALWISDPDLDLSGQTLIVEGEKKAMVAYLAADRYQLRVIGLPGKNPNINLLDQLKNCEPIYLCLDPDAGKESIGIASVLDASRCRLIELPEKIDDMILKYKLDNAWMGGIMRTARRF